MLTDIASAIGIPGGATISELVNAHLARRQNIAFDLLLEEMRIGMVTTIDASKQDEFISALWRFSRASIEGSARQNLRLLARAFAGLASSQSLYADEFKRYADALGDLTREEIVVLAALHKACVEMRAEKEYYAEDAVARLEQTLVSDEFPRLALHGTLAALSRTGLVARGSTMDDMAGWMTTPMMDKVAHLVRIDEAIG